MFTYDSSGNLLTEDAEPGADASYRDGLAFNPVTGALYVGGSGGHSVNGLSVDGKGRVQYDSGAPAVYHHGWPLSAVGAIIAQTGAIAAGTPFINGAFVDGSGIFVSDAGGWDPSALFASSEVGVWYDPSDLSTMFQNSNGTTAVAVGDPVGYIADKSGNGFHATQATEARRPILRQSAGGLYYLEFDGVDDFLVTSAIDFTATDKISVFHGINITSSAAVGTIAQLGGKYNAGGFNHQSPTAAGNTRIGFDIGGATGSVNRPIANHTLSVVSWLMDRGAVDISNEHVLNQVNGIPIIDVFSGTALTGNFGNLTLSLSSTAEFLNGSIFSFIVLGRLATTQEITDTETWVNSKTGAY